MYDALIIGGGAAGASCALWLTRLGLAPLLVDQSDRLGGLLNDSPFTNEWLVTQPAVTGPDLAAGIERSLEAAGTAVLRGHRVTRVARASRGFDISLAECAPITARYVVLASGVQPVRGGLVASERVLIGPGAHIAGRDFAGKRVAILGGGDNAFENHASVLGKGAERADLFARTVRAARWARRLVDPAAVHAGAYDVDAGQGTVNGVRYDLILVMYGWEPRQLPDGVEPERDAHGFVRVEPSTCETTCAGIFAVGEVTRRGHPCVSTATADGVVAAKAIQQRIEVS